MNGLIANSVPISQTTSNSDINYSQPPNPINFNSILKVLTFSLMMISPHHLTTYRCSPETNATSDGIAQNLDEVKVKLENHNQARLDALEFAFETNQY